MTSDRSTSGMLERYRRAAKFLPDRMAGHLRNTDVLPFWVTGQDRFWYQREHPDGRDFVLVDAASGRAALAFDHQALAQALTAVSGKICHAADLPFTMIEIEQAGIRFVAYGAEWLFDPARGNCVRIAAATAPHEVGSPDRSRVVFLRDDNLWMRQRADGEERPLTSDGAPGRSYGKSPDCNTATLSNRLAGVLLPPAIVWSPDSSRLVTHLLDETRVPLLHYLQSVPGASARPVPHAIHMAFPGDADVPLQHLAIIDVLTGRKVDIDMPPIIAAQVSAIEAMHVWWSEDGRTVFILDIGRASKSARLIAADATTGKTRILIEECAETFIELTQGAVHSRPLVRTPGNGEEIIWFSQRDGWGHLYLHEGDTGKLKNPITSGALLVREIHHVDLQARTLVFCANGPDVADDPYHRGIFRIGFDGTGLQRLTPATADYEISAVVPSRPREFRNPRRIVPGDGMATSGSYFVASASRIDMPAVTTLHRSDGTEVARIEEADISAARALGWQPPEAFMVLAADGVTPIYGALWRPTDFDPSRRYPILDFIYPGPQRIQTPKRCFARSERSAYCLSQAMAELGMIVVTIDGRGTPYRSKSFHDAAYLTQDNPGNLDDHIAAIRQLAAERSYIDMARIGIMGHSGGALASVWAMLKHPDFFKVAVSSSGNYDNKGYTSYWGEKYMGLMETRPDGTTVYDGLNCARLASRLQGKLLLGYGDLDDNVHSALTLQLVAAFIDANKDFDQIVVPNANHESIPGHPYWLRRKMDFLVRHLIGEEPPGAFRL